MQRASAVRASVRAILYGRRAPLAVIRQPSRFSPPSSPTTTGIKSLSTTSKAPASAAAVAAAGNGAAAGTTTTTAVTSANYVRNFTIALVSSLVLSSAWLAYRDAEKLLMPLSFTANPSEPNNRRLAGKEGPVRRIVAVDDHDLYMGIIEGDGPVSKPPFGESGGRKVLEMLSPEEASSKLRTSEESYFVGRDRGVYRYDLVQVPSNDPIEDDHAERIIEVPPAVVAGGDGVNTTDWMFWGVFDGHSGWTTSAKLRQVLIAFVARELNSTYRAAVKDASSPMPSPEAIDAAIKRGFVRLDNEIIHESVEKVKKNHSKVMAAELLAPALSGSCALLAFYDSLSQMLRIACTGDSRAVLGRKSPNGKWTATALSVDQTGSNEAEAARMRKEHPGEEQTVIRAGRVLGGLEPTRAFGDAFYKWSIDTQNTIKNKFFGRTPSSLLKSPPYVTAEPEVTTTKIQPENGDFLVLATDGLWEMLTNEEVVGLVGRWLEKHQASEAKAASSSGWFGGWFGGGKTPLPVENGEGGESQGGQRQPIRQRQWGITAPETERFTFDDANAATHLVRNALGGKNQEMVCALLTLPSPFSRRYRDDLTVQVIFFGQGDKSGEVVINQAATAKKVQAPKAD